MKIDRLLGILTVLMQREKVTAPELAAKFEVSRRTIQRDVEDICKAGIPVVTFQGGDGGISIAEGFKLDKTVISVDELQNIITGLKSIESVSAGLEIDRLITKISPKKCVQESNEKVLIDLASHYKNSLSDKINILKKAISQNRLVSFIYYSEKGTADRVIEPYLITYKWSSWYTYGYCTEKGDFRLFKLNRLWDLQITDSIFNPKEIKPHELDFDAYFQNGMNLTALFDKEVKYLLVEEYGPSCWEETENGKLKVSISFTNKEHILRWLLSFGDKVEIIEPAEIRDEIALTAKKISSLYEHDI